MSNTSTLAPASPGRDGFSPGASGTSMSLARTSLELYISPRGSDMQGDGSAERPFASLGRATTELRNAAAKTATPFPGEVSIAMLEGPASPSAITASASAIKPRFQYYLDPYTQETAGDGADSTPFATVDAAAESIAALHGAGVKALGVGQHLKLTTRQVFTATSIESGRRLRETIAKTVFMAMSVVLVLPLLAIFYHLIEVALPSLSLAFILENPRKGFTAGGIWAPLVGTFYLVILSLLAAAPIGVLAGVYLNEYARDNWFTRIVNLAVVNLAGVPSIVHALFGVGAFVVLTGKPSVLAASLTLAVMTLPVIITSTREALAAVPVSFREACWNMGASRWQTIRTIVLPNSIGGILTGVILQVSRAAGETAPILFTGAVLTKSRLPNSGIDSVFMYGLNDECMALSYHLYQVASNVPGVPASMQYSAAVVLIGLVLIVNSASIGLRTYLRSRKKW